LTDRAVNDEDIPLTVFESGPIASLFGAMVFPNDPRKAEIAAADDCARLRVGDLQTAERRLMVPVSKKGSGAKASHVPVPIDDDVVKALKPAIAGRLGSDHLLLRPRWRRAAGPELVMEKYGRGPWSAARSLTRIWKAVVERAGLPKTTVPYAFRHSSIVRGLRAGLPTQMVAKLHDTSSTMIERYYGRFITDALHELARKALVPLMPVAPVAAVRSIG
jgi:integrase